MRRRPVWLLLIALLAIACKETAGVSAGADAGRRKFGAVVEGQTTSGATMSLPLNADGTAVVVSGSVTPSAVTPDGGFATNGTLVSTQASALTALNLLTPPRTVTPVTKSDTTDTSSYCTKGLIVGTGGNVSVIGCDDVYDAGSAPVLTNIPDGTIIWGCFKRINANNTTASNMDCFGGTG